MSSFKALNIESDDEPDDEIDDTKEIQIEDALKDYQTALKFHSQGSRYVKEAEEAYDTLFKSDIFKYAESQSEYVRWEAYHKQEDLGGALPIVTEVQATQSAPDNSAGTLPQILHLSYKNRGQFFLDQLKILLEQSSADGLHVSEHEGQRLSTPIREKAERALRDFTEALDKDELDLDLWRRAAKVSEALGSKRMARYCLEAALEDDLEEGTDEVLGMPSLEISLTGNDLVRVQRELDDQLSLAQPLPLGLDDLEPPEHLRKHLSLYSFLPDTPPKTPEKDETSAIPQRIVLKVDGCSWERIGLVLLRELQAESKGKSISYPGGAYSIEISDAAEFNDKHVTSPVNSLRAESEKIEEASVPIKASSTSDPHEGAPDPKSDSALSATEARGKGDTAEVQSTDAHHIPMEVTVPLRKRSTEAAELPETADGGRARSKRLRARESIVGEPGTVDGDTSGAAVFNSELHDIIQADTYLFEILNHICSKAGIDSFMDPKSARALVTQGEEVEAAISGPISLAMKDLFSVMQAWDDSKTAVLTESSKLDEGTSETRNDGFSAFLESSTSLRHSSQPNQSIPGAAEFATWTSNQWLTLPEIAEAWVRSLTDPYWAAATTGVTSEDGASSYKKDVWHSDLKRVFCQILDMVDQNLLTKTRDATSQLLGGLATQLDAVGSDEDVLGSRKQVLESCNSSGLLEFAQAMFELHLDVYTRLSSPDSVASQETKTQGRYRLDQWCEIARELHMTLVAPEKGNGHEICFRHLWATAFHLRASGDVDREHVLLCIDDLRRLAKSRSSIVTLANNSAMPELSLAAADREMSKLETMDFFYSIFRKGKQDPVDLIERLEPVLLSPPGVSESLDGNGKSVETTDSSSPRAVNPRKSSTEVLAEFLDNASPSLRLSLWRRLREAYQTIEFPPKALLIDLTSMGLIIRDIKSANYSKMAADERQIILLVHLRDLDDLLKKVLHSIDTNDDVLDSLDLQDLKMGLNVVSDLWMLLHVMALWDDHSQVLHKGPAMINPFRAYPSETFHPASIKFHEMQIRIYMLWYKVLVRAMLQMPEEFQTAMEMQWEYLRHVHYALGVRRLCKASDSMFLHFMRTELLKTAQGGVSCDDDISQILWDLYELYCFSQPIMKQDHGCDADYLDRPTALKLLDFVLDKAQKIPVKDLIKSELGRTIEKMNTALGPTKSTNATSRNKRVFNSYIKSPLHPMQLYRSLQGVLEVSTVPLPPEEAVIASKGWYFLRGQMALARYRSSRAAGKPGDEDDLEEAINLFGQDLEYSGERWETWFRLGQANDALLEEQVLWSAEKLNNAREELAQVQRASIHSYAMAVASAAREADTSESTKMKLAELYHDFGMRVYSSARPPFAMLPFALRSFGERHFSGSPGGASGIYTKKAFKPMRSRQAWRFAQACFKKSLDFRPRSWQAEYMLGKCVWKQFTLAREEQRQEEALALAEQAVDHFLTAIEQIPERKDRDKSEPTLEPIYKLVSVLHKLVVAAVLPPDDGADTILDTLKNQAQFDANKLPPPCTASVYQEHESEWLSWVLEVFKVIRHADKAKWHHRIVFNAAQIIFDQGGGDENAARAAKSYLLDEKMYSVKTLALSVWKPDNERPGRHWVFMNHYARFLVQLLEQTQDIEAIQILTRRVRKKPAEFYHHEQLWPIVCNAHLRMHRRLGNVVDGVGDTLEKSMMNDDFGTKGARLDAWISSPENQKNVLVDVLREVSELRKINANLMSSAPIDRLCGDTYATIFREISPTLEPTSTLGTPSQQPAQAALPIAQVQPPSAPPAPPRVNPMSLNNLMNIDGGRDSSPKASPAPPATSTPAPEAPSKPKARLVSMREILKRAYESVLPLSKSAAQVSGNAGLRKSDSTANVRIVINAGSDGEGVSTDGTGPGTATAGASDKKQSASNEQGDPSSSGLAPQAGTALDGDSADESELSDPPLVEDEEEEEGEEEEQDGMAEDEDEGDEEEDEDEPPSRGPSLFPHLDRTVRGGSTSGIGSDVEMSDADGLATAGAAAAATAPTSKTKAKPTSSSSRKSWATASGPPAPAAFGAAASKTAGKDDGNGKRQDAAGKERSEE